MSRAGPRSFNPTGVLDAGVHGGRCARQAAGQAFVALKLTYLQALEGLPAADWLRRQVRAAQAPLDLWLLRAPVFTALEGCEPACAQRRQQLQRGLDSAFPDLDRPRSDFAPF